WRLRMETERRAVIATAPSFLGLIANIGASPLGGQCVRRIRGIGASTQSASALSAAREITGANPLPFDRIAFRLQTGIDARMLAVGCSGVIRCFGVFFCGMARGI